MIGMGDKCRMEVLKHKGIETILNVMELPYALFRGAVLMKDKGVMVGGKNHLDHGQPKHKYKLQGTKLLPSKCLLSSRKCIMRATYNYAEETPEMDTDEDNVESTANQDEPVIFARYADGETKSFPRDALMEMFACVCLLNLSENSKKIQRERLPF